MTRPHFVVVATTLDAPDADALASFYEKVLGWQRVTDKPTYVGLRPPTGGPGLCFQTEPNYVAPVWPSEPGAQLMMSHLEIGVDDLDAAQALAIDAGATLADYQPQEHVRVMLDPAGHPFCLFLGKEHRGA
jgi:catechol 2,3-dioxygenase-like lactoylglutathione lyase family enzyme